MAKVELLPVHRRRSSGELWRMGDPQEERRGVVEMDAASDGSQSDVDVENETPPGSPLSASSPVPPGCRGDEEEEGEEMEDARGRSRSPSPSSSPRSRDSSGGGCCDSLNSSSRDLNAHPHHHHHHYHAHLQITNHHLHPHPRFSNPLHPHSHLLPPPPPVFHPPTSHLTNSDNESNHDKSSQHSGDEDRENNNNNNNNNHSRTSNNNSNNNHNNCSSNDSSAKLSFGISRILSSDSSSGVSSSRKTPTSSATATDHANHAVLAGRAMLLHARGPPYGLAPSMAGFSPPPAHLGLPPSTSTPQHPPPAHLPPGSSGGPYPTPGGPEGSVLSSAGVIKVPAHRPVPLNHIHGFSPLMFPWMQDRKDRLTGESQSQKSLFSYH